MADVSLKQKVTGIVNNVRYNWKEPAVGKYMPYKEIAAYAFGGIGAYFIIQLGSTLIVSTANIIVSTAIGVGPTHTYIIYLIATLLNIPLTGIRANMIDNTRGKGGKYRPYLLSMGIPTALIALVYVWFPYELMYDIFPGKMFGYEKGYWIKVAVVFICNLALHFFFNFFRDAYENLIHVLSPNTQERTDVLAVKAVVYSRRLYRVKRILFRFALRTLLKRLRRISISGLSRLPDGSDSLSLHIQTFFSIIRATATRLRVISTLSRGRLSVTRRYGVCFSLRSL